MKVKMKNLANIDCWIFDLDNTLYPASTDLFAQVCEKMSTYIANTLNVDKAKQIKCDMNTGKNMELLGWVNEKFQNRSRSFFGGCTRY